MLLPPASFPLPHPPTPLSAFFTQSHVHRPYPPKKHPPRSLGPLSTTEKYMRFACGSLLSLLLVLLAQTSVGGSGDGAVTVMHNDALYPLLCLDGSSSDSRQNGTPLSTMTPAPALAAGLLTLLWVWVLDGAVLPLRVRGSAAAKGVCRCRVCTLRMQARGRPLHDVSPKSANANKALGGWS